MKSILTLTAFLFIFAGCGQENKDLQNKSVDELFNKIDPAQFSANIFKLVGEDNMAVTSGGEFDYNSMAAGWGGWGIFFNKPATWGVFNPSRNTLKYIKKNRTYTWSFFDAKYKDQIVLFGSSSGADSDKMKKHTLTPALMPNGSVAYKEATLIVECSLMEITGVKPEDFFGDEMKSFIESGLDKTGEYHKLVFGQITGLWVKK